MCAEQQTNLNDGLHSAIDMLLRVLAVSKCVTIPASARCARATGRAAQRRSVDALGGSGDAGWVLYSAACSRPSSAAILLFTDGHPTHGETNADAIVQHVAARMSSAPHRVPVRSLALPFRPLPLSHS